jgi:hypothetical protein
MFEFTLVEVRWFGKEVVYLAPESVESVRRLTDPLVETFSAHHRTVVSSTESVTILTVADGPAAVDMRRAALDLRRVLPLREKAEQIHLMVGDNRADSWYVAARFPLESASPP